MITVVFIRDSIIIVYHGLDNFGEQVIETTKSDCKFLIILRHYSELPKSTLATFQVGEHQMLDEKKRDNFGKFGLQYLNTQGAAKLQKIV